MKQFLITFDARVLKENGWEWETLERLVEAPSFPTACSIVKNLNTEQWDYLSPHNFNNLTI